jgi:hypothetical protein
VSVALALVGCCQGYEMNDMHVVIRELLIQAAPTNELAEAYRLDALRAQYPPLLFYAPGEAVLHTPSFKSSVLGSDLPPNLHLHTLAAVGSDIACDPFHLDRCARVIDNVAVRATGGRGSGRLFSPCAHKTLR